MAIQDGQRERGEVAVILRADVQSVPLHLSEDDAQHLSRPSFGAYVEQSVSIQISSIQVNVSIPYHQPHLLPQVHHAGMHDAVPSICIGQNRIGSVLEKSIIDGESFLHISHVSSHHQWAYAAYPNGSVGVAPFLQ